MTRGSCWKHNFCQFERGVQSNLCGQAVVVLVICLVAGILHHLLDGHLGPITDPPGGEDPTKASLAKHLIDDILGVDVPLDPGTGAAASAAAHLLLGLAEN